MALRLDWKEQAQTINQLFHLVEVKDTASMQTYDKDTRSLTNKHINAPLSKGLDTFFIIVFE